MQVTSEKGEQTYNNLANKEVFNAPEESKYDSFQELWQDAKDQRARCTEHVVDLKHVAVLPGEMQKPETITVLDGETEIKGELTNYSYKQIVRMAGVNLGMIERLKPETRSRVINELMPREDSRVGQILLENVDGVQKVRAFTGSQYKRLWDDDVCGEVDRWLLGSGWTPASPTFRYSGPEEGKPKCLVRDDRSSFMFFMKDGDGGQSDDLGGLRRGLAVWNSETGDRMFGWTSFLFRDICANLLIWGMQEQMIYQVVHRQGIVDGFGEFKKQVAEMGTTITDEEFDFLHKAADVEFAPNVEGAEKRLNKMGVTKKVAKASVELAQTQLGGEDLSVWSVTNGLTAYANTLSHGRDRIDIQQKAGEILTGAMA